MTSQPIATGDGERALSEVAATRLRGLMAEQRMTQLDVARTLNLSRSGVSDRLTGVKPVNLDELPALASLLGTSIDYLLGLTNDRSPRRGTPGGGSLFVMPERTSGFTGALRACRDSNPKPSVMESARRAARWLLGRVIPARRRRAALLAFHTDHPLAVRDESIGRTSLRLVADAVEGAASDEQPAARIPAGHHPSCPAAHDTRSTCVGCGPHLSVVA